MKAKKLIAVILTLSMICTMSAGVFAEDAISAISGENSIVVSYNTAQNYEIVIPVESASIGSPKELEIKAVNVLLPEGKKLQVSMSSENNFSLNLTSGGLTSSVPYAVVLNGESIGSGTKILSVASGETSGKVTLLAAVVTTDYVRFAGTHTDKLKFTCEIVDDAAKETIVSGGTDETTTTTGGTDETTTTTGGTDETTTTTGGTDETTTTTTGTDETTTTGTETTTTTTTTSGTKNVGQAGAAGNAAEGGGQELGPQGEDPRPYPSNPDPDPPHPSPYSYQRY